MLQYLDIMAIEATLKVGLQDCMLSVCLFIILFLVMSFDFIFAC